MNPADALDLLHPSLVEIATGLKKAIQEHRAISKVQLLKIEDKRTRNRVRALLNKQRSTLMRLWRIADADLRRFGKLRGQSAYEAVPTRKSMLDDYDYR